MADTVPFFSDYRLIIVENSGFFAASGHETLAEYMKQIPETTCIVICGIRGRQAQVSFLRRFRLTGYAANLTMPGDKQLMLWLGRNGEERRTNSFRNRHCSTFLQIGGA